MEEVRGQLVVEAGEALPQGRVLSYITTASTPTRVRRLAGIAARCVGWAYVGTVVLICGIMVDGIVDYAVRMFGPPLSVSRLYDAAMWELGRADGIATMFVLAVLAVLACIMLFVGRSVERGNARACRVAWWGSFLLFLGLFPVVATLVIAALLIGLDVGGGTSSWRWLGWLWLLPAGAILLGVMVLLDVLGFLGWIMRNPITEKPPIPFLAGK